jgi:methionine synthase I (cobalamin-dependent)
MTDRDIARNAGIKSAKLESQGQLNIFNQSSAKAAAKIAPDTAKKVKRAIAGVKGGKKTTKAMSPQQKRIAKEKPVLTNGARYVQITIKSGKEDLIKKQVPNAKIIGSEGFGSDRTIVTIFNTEKDLANLKKFGAKVNKHDQPFAKARETREKGGSVKKTGMIDIKNRFRK